MYPTGVYNRVGLPTPTPARVLCMPPLDDLPPANPTAAAAAARMPLVHVCSGRADRPPLWEFAADGIPTSAVESGYAGPGTRYVEDQVGYPRSVYFYAGRACPDYGQVALAFPPAAEAGRFDSATPFGTGGVVKPDLATAFPMALAPDTLDARVAYCRASTTPADRRPGWRAEFGRWLAHYFPSGAAGYWGRPPERHDPEQLYAGTADWQAWVWEVRFRAGPPAFEAEFWTVDRAESVRIVGAVAAGLFTPADAAVLDAFMARCLTPGGHDHFCAVLEAEVRRRCP